MLLAVCFVQRVPVSLLLLGLLRCQCLLTRGRDTRVRCALRALLQHRGVVLHGSGCDEDPKVSGKPDYDGSLKQWRSVKISLRSYLHVKQKLQVVQHGVSNKATANKDTHTTSELSKFETPATRLAPLITSSIKAHKASIQWYIYVQDTSVFIGDTDLQLSLASS